MFNFYVSYKLKKIYCSDYPLDKARRHFHNDVELVNSIKDKEYLDVIKARVMRTFPGFELVEQMQKPKYVMTPEHKHALLMSKLGKKRSDEVKRKISEKNKGKSGFQGKKHRPDSKRLIGAAKLGNQVNKDLIWIHNPDTDQERKVKDRKDIPKGFSEGRDYYSTEPGLYVMNSKKTTTW